MNLRRIHENGHQQSIRERADTNFLLGMRLALQLVLDARDKEAAVRSLQERISLREQGIKESHRGSF